MTRLVDPQSTPGAGRRVDGPVRPGTNSVVQRALRRTKVMIDAVARFAYDLLQDLFRGR